MKSSTKQITLTKIKQWYMPVDAESYKTLKAAGVPLVRIPENFIPTLKILIQSKKIKTNVVDFNDTILHPYLDELGTRWQKKEHRTVTINASVLKFETTHSSAREQALVPLDKIEASLRRFFTRWGYTATFERSENRGKHKLHVTYKYDSSKSPIISLVEDAESLPKISVELGFLRIQMTFGEKEIETNISLATGPSWTSIQTSRCLYSQVSDVRPMIAGLMKVVDKDHHNADNKRS